MMMIYDLNNNYISKIIKMNYKKSLSLTIVTNHPDKKSFSLLVVAKQPDKRKYLVGRRKAT
jgi:hypothetical protein